MGDITVTTAACTIASLNYLGFARTLAQSFRKTHPDCDFYLLIVDRCESSECLDEEDFKTLMVEDLGIHEFSKIAFQYDVLELNTNVKPTLLKHLLQNGYEQVIYFDPDIEIYSRLDPVFDALERASVVITPHSLSPLTGDLRQEVRFLATGTYNLGFIAIRRGPESSKMLNWWEDRCLSLAYSEIASGLFVDQKWINLAAVYFAGVDVLRHPGCNVAYWNLHERTVTKANEGWVVNHQYPLVFFHFSGVSSSGNTISKYTDIYTLLNRPQMIPLFEGYRARLEANGVSAQRKSPYAFAHFSNGVPIPPLLRAIYSSIAVYLDDSDPFDADGDLYRWAKGVMLLERRNGESSPQSKTRDWRDDYRVKFVNAFLAMTLRVIGVARYSQLLKYFSHVSIPRNQIEVFRGKLSPRNSKVENVDLNQ